MSEWFTTLKGTQQQIWERLAQAAKDSDLISFATVSASGRPEVRTVVLRAADRDAGTLEVYTDLLSDKVDSLKANPHAAICLWDESLQLQIRAETDVTIQSGDPVKERWAAIPDHSRLSYGVTPAPGTQIADSEDYKKAPDPAVFAVLVCHVTAFDAVHLGRPHRRARYQRKGPSHISDWDANWLAP